MNVMNKIQRALLMLYSEDENADNTTVENTLKQGISILAKLTSIAVYAYQSKNHFFNEESLYIHQIDSSVSIAENILRLLRPNKEYLPEEVRILDLLLVVHIDHGSGNNSTFVNSVIASTNTDIYSSFSASVGSLKGTKHGGANISCLRMMDTIIREIGLDANDDQIEAIINRILDKKFFDGSGLIYGMGHAVYTMSDPRAMIIKHEALKLAKIKKQELRLEFYSRFENITKKVVMARKNINICSNVDFYSGLVYGMLDIPEDLFTPLFVISRSCGWIAHNIENKLYANKIIRPAGRYVGDLYEYVKMEDRK
jgi:citrate synthase